MLKSISKSPIIKGLQSNTMWKLLFWVIFTLLLYLTLTPSPPKPISLNQIDKLYHLCAFAGFTFIFKTAFKRVKPVIIFLLSASLGIMIEVLQYYIPNRGFSLADMLADIAGVCIGFYFAGKFSLYFQK